MRLSTDHTSLLLSAAGSTIYYVLIQTCTEVDAEVARYYVSRLTQELPGTSLECVIYIERGFQMQRQAQDISAAGCNSTHAQQTQLRTPYVTSLDSDETRCSWLAMAVCVTPARIVLQSCCSLAHRAVCCRNGRRQAQRQLWRSISPCWARWDAVQLTMCIATAQIQLR